MATSFQSKILLYESFDIIGSTTILGVFYGIAFTLYCLCAWSLYLQLQDPDKQRKTRFTLGYISLVLFCATALLALNTGMNQLAYISHADYPGGPLGYEGSYSLTTNSYEVVDNLLDLILEVSTMAIQIRRLWIVWSGTQYAVAVTVLPLLLLLSFIALDIPAGVVADLVPPDQLRISAQSGAAINTASYTVLSAFTILVTGLIAARILLARRYNVRLMGASGTSGPYLSVIAMLTESYALESAWSIASAISRGLNNPSFYLFETNDSIIKVIAYFLIVYRVASGRAWDKDTGRKLTSLRFDRDAQTTTNEASGIQSQVPVTVAGNSQPVSSESVV